MVRNVAGEFADMVIKILDSNSLSMGVGFPVIEAALAAKAGRTFEQVVAKAEEVISKMETYFVVGTLEYLIKGGRMGYVSGTIGELLQVKPIISINEEGKYFTLEKVRGRKRSLQRMCEIISERVADKIGKAAVCHGDAEDEAKELAEKLRQIPNIKEVVFCQVGPVIGVHSGPGLIGVVVY
jgi:DegV family protein with EDD domain